MSSEKRRGWGWFWGKKESPKSAEVSQPSNQRGDRPSIPTTQAPSRSPLSITNPNEESMKTSDLAQLQLKKVVRSTSGELMAVDPSSIRILLAGMNGITQILLSGQLEEFGFVLEYCEDLQSLPIHLARFGPPRLVIFEAEQARASLKFFRERIYPLLQSAGLACLLVGTGKMPEQDAAWRGWFRGAFTLEQEMSEIMKQVRLLTNAKM